MPTYEYNCSKCERKFDIHQSFKDNALEVCPLPALNGKATGTKASTKTSSKTNGSSKTGKAKEAEPVLCGGTVRKVFSSVGISFKGSGFYRNDSRSGGSSNGTKHDRTDADGSDKKSDTKSGDASEKSGEKSAGKGTTKSDGKSKSDSKSQKSQQSQQKPAGSDSSGRSGKDKSAVNA